jgi:hypothetical protein
MNLDSLHSLLTSRSPVRALAADTSIAIYEPPRLAAGRGSP